MVPIAIAFLSLVLLSQSGAAGPDAMAEAARGTALARDGKSDLAIEHYKAALRLSSHLPGLQLNLGLAYFKSNHLREAAARRSKKWCGPIAAVSSPALFSV